MYSRECDAVGSPRSSSALLSLWLPLGSLVSPLFPSLCSFLPLFLFSPAFFRSAILSNAFRSTYASLAIRGTRVCLASPSSVDWPIPDVSQNPFAQGESASFNYAPPEQAPVSLQISDKLVRPNIFFAVRRRLPTVVASIVHSYPKSRICSNHIGSNRG